MWNKALSMSIRCQTVQVSGNCQIQMSAIFWLFANIQVSVGLKTSIIETYSIDNIDFLAL